MPKSRFTGLIPEDDRYTLKANVQELPVARSARVEWVLHVLLLVALAAAFFAPVLARPNDLIYPSYSPFSDLTVIHWPNAKALADGYDTYGWIPWWKNVSLSGMPAIANPLAMLFYPLNFLFLVLPIDPVFNLLTGLHLILSGVSLYVFLRAALGRSGSAALVASALYMFSGKLMAHVAAGHLSLVAAMAWVPWAFLALHWAIARRSLVASILLGALLALQAVTHTQIFIYTVYALCLYAAFELWSAPRDATGGVRGRTLGRSLLVLLPAPIVAGALGAVQLLPLLELARQSDRAFSLVEASAYSLSALQLLVGVVLPSPSAGHELTIYPGLTLLILALLALSRRADRRVFFFCALAGVAGLVSLGAGGGLFALLYWAAPGWAWMRAAARSWLFVSFAGSVLAAHGLDRLRSADRPLRWITAVVAGLAFTGLLLGAGLIGLYGQVSRATLVLAFLPLALWAVVALRGAGKLSPAVALGAVLVLGLADLWTFDLSLIRLVTPDAAFADRADLAHYLSDKKAIEGPFRTYSPSYSLPQHLAAQYGLETVDGVEPVHLSRYDRFMALAGGYGLDAFSVTIPPFPGDGRLDAWRGVVPDARLLGLLNVHYVLADFPVQSDGLSLDRQVGPTYVYRNDRALPRAYAVTAAQSVANGPAALQALASLDSARAAVVEGPLPAGLPAETAGRNPPKNAIPVRVTLLTANKIAAEVAVEAPSLLVLSEIAYPGWRAYVDGVPTPILRVNYLLRGVSLMSGPHTVTWVYDPSSLAWGLHVTQIGLLLTLLALVFWAYRRTMKAGGRP